MGIFTRKPKEPVQHYKIIDGVCVFNMAPHYSWLANEEKIPENLIEHISPTEMIVTWAPQKSIEGDPEKAIENKTAYDVYEETHQSTYQYDTEIGYWSLVDVQVVDRQLVRTVTPYDTLKEHGHYSLIETEDEMRDYLNGPLDLFTWCRTKLYHRMSSFGLDNGFIDKYARYVGMDYLAYTKMLELYDYCANTNKYVMLNLFKHLYLAYFVEEE